MSPARRKMRVMRGYAEALREAQPRIDAAMDRARREQEAMMRAVGEHTLTQQESATVTRRGITGDAV